MKLIFAIGNPGKKYYFNRHSLGLFLADILIKECALSDLKSKEKYDLFGNSDFKLIKSKVFMNLSFSALQEFYNLYKFSPKNILVLHDELMLDEYDIRLKLGGGNAGHNGLRSIAQNIGSDFARLRIGIGHPKGVLDIAVDEYVLSDIKNLEKWKEIFTQKAIGIINAWLADV